MASPTYPDIEDAPPAPPPESSPGPIGVTANTVNAQAASSNAPMDSFEYHARGGQVNTASQGAQQVNQMVKYQQSKKTYENLLGEQMEGAQKAYGQLKDSYPPDKFGGEDVTSWVPDPKLFVDSKTGAFLPHQYYKSAYIGIQKFKEYAAQQADIKQKQTFNEDKQKELDAYRNKRVDQGDTKLGIDQEAVDIKAKAEADKKAKEGKETAAQVKLSGATSEEVWKQLEKLEHEDFSGDPHDRRVKKNSYVGFVMGTSKDAPRFKNAYIRTIYDDTTARSLGATPENSATEEQIEAKKKSLRDIPKTNSSQNSVSGQTKSGVKYKTYSTPSAATAQGS